MKLHGSIKVGLVALAATLSTLVLASVNATAESKLAPLAGPPAPLVLASVNATAENNLAPLAGPPALAGPPDLRSYADSLVAGLDPTTHGGVYVDVTTRSVTVMTVGPTAEAIVKTRISSLRGPASVVSTKAVTRSEASLESLRDYDLWRRLPGALLPHVFGAQIDTLSNRVVVEVDEPSTDIRRELKSLFGDAVSVRRGDRGTVATMSIR